MPNTTQDELEIETRTCDHCGDDFDEGDGYDDDRFCCEGCYDSYYQDDDNDDNDSIPERKWCKGDFAEFQSKDFGEIIKSQRAFSIEIETYYKRSDDVNYIYSNTPEQVGISGDGSLSSRGVELQTPKLRGQKGENLVRKITDLLNEKNFRVDRSCGLHVHIDGSDLSPRTRTKHTPQTIKNLLMLYITYEDVLQSILPRSRRNNRYAQYVRNNFHCAEIEKCHSLEAIEKLWYRVAKRKDLTYQKSEHYNSTRYNGLNLHSLFTDGHLEIRYHSGTINAEKILHWCQLHLAMVDYAKKMGYIDRQPEVTDLREKTKTLFDKLALSDQTRQYYQARQNLFSGTTTEETENRNN